MRINKNSEIGAVKLSYMLMSIIIMIYKSISYINIRQSTYIHEIIFFN